MANEDAEQPQGAAAEAPHGASEAPHTKAAPKQVAEEAVPPAGPPSEPEPPEITVYHQTVWNGYKAFICNFCGHGVLDVPAGEGKAAMDRHIWEDHQKPTAPRHFSGLLVDSQGRPITG